MSSVPKIRHFVKGKIFFKNENQRRKLSLGVRSYPTLKYLAPRNPGQPISTPQNFPYQQRDEFSFIHFLSAELTRHSPVANASPQKNIFNYIQRVHQDGRHVLIDFYANWCRPCKQFEPYYQLASIKVTCQAFFKFFMIISSINKLCFSQKSTVLRRHISAAASILKNIRH